MLDIVIVNWNAGKLLRSCVNSINQNDDGLVNKIIVVDNASVDGSDELVEGIEKVTLIQSKSNLGFAKACNLGARSATNEFILFLNPDTVIFPETFTKVTEFMDDQKQDKVGVCGISLLEEDGSVWRNTASFPTFSSMIFHSMGFDRFIAKLGYVNMQWDHAKTRQVDHVIGAFYLVRRTVFEQLQGFDDRFFVYLEDLDFSLRAKKAGWNCVYFAGANSFHLGGGTSEQVKATRLFYALRARLLYVHKHLGFLQTVIITTTTLIVEPFLRALGVLITSSFGSLKEILLAYGLLFRWLPRWFKGQ